MLPSPKYHKHIAMNRRDFETMLIGLGRRMDDPKAPKEDRAVCAFLILRLNALPYEMEIFGFCTSNSFFVLECLWRS